MASPSFAPVSAAERFAQGDHAFCARLAGHTGALLHARRTPDSSHPLRQSDSHKAITPSTAGWSGALARRPSACAARAVAGSAHTTRTRETSQSFAARANRTKSRRDRQTTNSTPGSTGATSSRHAARNLGKLASAPAGYKDRRRASSFSHSRIAEPASSGKSLAAASTPVYVDSHWVSSFPYNDISESVSSDPFPTIASAPTRGNSPQLLPPRTTGSRNQRPPASLRQPRPREGRATAGRAPPQGGRSSGNRPVPARQAAVRPAAQTALRLP